MISPRIWSLAASLSAAALTVALLPALPAAASGASSTAVETSTIDGPALERTLPGAVHESEPAEVAAFTLVGFEVPEGAELLFRTSPDGRSWGDWTEAPTFVQEGDVVDPGEGGPSWAHHTEPIWVGEASWLQTRVTGADPAEVTAHLIDTEPDPGWRDVASRATAAVGSLLRPAEAWAAASAPAMVSRAQWGAGQSGTPRTADRVRAGTLHHTAGSNSYTCAQAPGIVRGIWSYHTATLGWSDVGYHFMVDKCGVVYEGRAGGIDRPVIGAHAGGFNTGTFGISILGEYSRAAPSQAALNAVADVVGWKFALHGIDPAGRVTLTSAGSTRYSAGTSVTLPTFFGHRDVSATACPGDALYALLSDLRTRVAARKAVHAQSVPPPPVGGGSVPITPSPSAPLPRLGGGDPIGTSVAVSSQAFSAGAASHAVVTHTATFADAMTAGPLAGRNGPVLYTGSTLHASVEAELQRVLPPNRTVYVVGGDAVVPRAVTDALARRWNVRRLAGPSRLETAAAVAQEVVALHGRRVALVARAYGGAAPWADAVAGGAYGARHATPVLLTEGDRLSGPTRSALGALRIERTVVLGGTGAVGDAAMRALPAPLRVAGQDRTGTAVAVATQLWGRPVSTNDRFVIVGGYGEADWTAALAAAPLVARRDAPLLLTARDALSPATGQYLRGRGYSLSNRAGGWVVGNGVSDATAAAAASLLGH